jgi:hypothetical protein
MKGINRYRIDKIRGKDLNSAFRRIWSWNHYEYVSPLRFTDNIGTSGMICKPYINKVNGEIWKWTN